MLINSFQATQLLRDELAGSSEHDFAEEASTLVWSHGGREYLVSLVLFDVTKEGV